MCVCARSIPVHYSWEVPEKYRGMFSVSPEEGVLRGKQELKLNLIFTPTQVWTKECAAYFSKSLPVRIKMLSDQIKLLPGFP